MRIRTISLPALFLVSVLLAVPCLAGGPPSFAFDAPGAGGADVLVVHAFSCHAPTDAAVSARAEGMVGGSRRSIPLTLKPTGSTGVYGVTRQWPAEGSWVLVFSVDRGGQTTALVKLDAQGMPVFTSAAGKPGRELQTDSLRTLPGAAKERDIQSVLVAKY